MKMERVNLLRYFTPTLFLLVTMFFKEMVLGVRCNQTQPILTKKRPNYSPPNTSGHDVVSNRNGRVSGGHWEYKSEIDVPYNFSYEVCMGTHIHQADCDKTVSCAGDLMNWRYYINENKPYQRFDVDGFRTRMRNRRIIFVGDSTARQQVEALIWTLGHDKVDWEVSERPRRVKGGSCHTRKFCMMDELSNIKICYQHMGTMVAKVYLDGNYTLAHASETDGDTSCLLNDKMIGDFSKFDLVFVQGVVWWAGLPKVLNSTTSPSAWVAGIVPIIYKDAMGALLSKLSQRTKTILVLGQVGASCQNKTEPEQYSLDDIPGLYNWNLAPRMWNSLLGVIEKRSLDVQVIDARDPVMQSVHAHPSSLNDCLHFCMNSAAVNIYLDIYWNEVFSNYVQAGPQKMKRNTYSWSDQQ
ncbi:hypothetical protein ACHAW6_012289 [Cyclotella cf. meneghiniana]